VTSGISRVLKNVLDKIHRAIEQ